MYGTCQVWDFPFVNDSNDINKSILISMDNSIFGSKERYVSHDHPLKTLLIMLIGPSTDSNLVPNSEWMTQWMTQISAMGEIPRMA